MPYTSAEVNILVILNILASTFSFLGATFIITNFFLFEEFRANFAFKLILFVAIGDIINSVGNFMGSPSDGSALCILQALLTQFGDIVSFAWVTAIAAVIYNVIRREVRPTREDVERWYKTIHLIIWPTTISLSILPLFTGNYGFDNALCWITFEPKPYGELWRWLCFYIPLWASIAFVSIMYYRVWGQLTAPEIQRQDSGPSKPKASANTADADKTDNINNDIDAENAAPPPQSHPHAAKPSVSISDVFDPDIGHKRQYSSNDVVAGGYQPSATDMAEAKQQSIDDNKTPKSGGGTLQRIKFYPFVLFGCYLFATIRRIAEWASTDHVAPFGVAACQVFTSALLGTCNAILYGFTPVVRAKDSEWIRATFCGSKGDEDDGVGNDGIGDSGNDNVDTGNESIR